VKVLLEALAQGLVDEPSRVVVTEQVEGDTVRFALQVAPADRGRVIGRSGRTAQALRTVMDAVARRRGQEADVEILG